MAAQLHSFGPSPDGTFPYGPVLAINGNLAEATNNGVLFRIVGSNEKVLRNFASKSSYDARAPMGDLLYVNGTL